MSLSFRQAPMSLASTAARRFKSYDVVIVGGGPGGYVAALKAGQSGLKVACVENRGTLGGTCLNVGCIPTKSMLQSTHVFKEAVHGGKIHGFSSSSVTSDYSKMTGARDGTVKNLTKGIEFLFKKNKVDYIKGKGALTGGGSLVVSGQADKIDAKHIILATGSVPSPMPGGFLKVDNEKVITSDGLMNLKNVPKKILIIGGGAIGLECATIMARLGSTVEIIEFMPQVAAGFDKEVSDGMIKLLKKDGVKVHLNHKVVNADTTGSVLKLQAEDKSGKMQEFSGDMILVAVGRRPFTEGLGLEKAGVETDRFGRVTIDKYYNTNVEGIHAIGDIVEGPMLAHKAEEDGVACINNIMGHKEAVDYSAVPGVIYSFPEAASVGKTEDALKKEGIAYTKGFFPMMANSRARCNQETEGFVKVLADKKTGLLLGACILAPNAGDLIQEYVMAIKYNITVKQIADLVHAHPTTSEALKEAALMAAYGKAMHA